MRRARSLKSKKGFLLFEVMVSIVVVTAGLLTVTGSFSSSQRSVERSREAIDILLLSEGRFWQFEEKLAVKEGVSSGDFEGDGRYAWQVTAARIKNSNLSNVVFELFELSKDGSRREERYSFQTYLKHKD